MTPQAGAVRWIRIRMAFLGALLLGALAALLGRAARLQLGEGARLARLAREQYRLEVALPARRGDILDRHGVALASSVQVDSIYADPSQIPDPEEAAIRLAAALRLDSRSLLRKLDPGSHFVWVKRQVAAAESLAVERLALPGIGTVKESRRFYPERELAAQVLGFTGLDGEGLEGLERRYDSALHGKPAALPGLRDARGRVIAEGVVPSADLEGATLELTLDRNLEFLAQQALDRQVAQSRAAAGIAIVMEPSTGAILALAISPTFNPNSVAPRDRDALRDRAVTDAYEPGSTMKAFVAAAVLQEKIATPGTQVFAENGAWAVGGRTIHDHAPFGWLTLARVLQVSSNIGAAKFGLGLGRERLHEYLNAFGFGERTDVGLPGEVRGTIGPFRSDISNATASFGQGVTATPLQIVAGYAALANGGVLLRPRIVQRVARPDGSSVENPPREIRRVVSQAVAASVTRMLEAVVQKGGTAEAAAVPGYRVAGKTGTAQKVDPVAGGYSADKRFASFVGIVPARAPRLVIGVFVDEPKGKIYGGEVAAPVFREIAEGALRQLGIPPTEPVAAAAPMARSNARGAVAPALSPGWGEGIFSQETNPLPRGDGTGGSPPKAGRASPAVPAGPVTPSVLGLPARRAVRALALAGLSASLSGGGRVIAQTPAPGAARPADGTVGLRLAEVAPVQPVAKAGDWP